ncbi:MAG: hypothetical protein ACRDVM_02765 [Acidimicrobiia bacterium]
MRGRAGGLLMTVVMVGALTACGDDPLAQAGNRSSTWIQEASGGPPLTPTVTTVPVIRAHRSSSLTWVNDELGVPVVAGPREVLRAVWTRGGQDRFVQASRSEIAAALPAVQFPSVVPEAVEYVTSQLVFDPETGSLSDEWAAAFGLWSVVPYSRSRNAGQEGVLWVAADGPGGSSGCERFPDRQEECETATLSDGPAWRLSEDYGSTLVWFEEGYRYELFTRRDVPEDLALRMAEEMAPLAELSDGRAAGTTSGVSP